MSTIRLPLWILLLTMVSWLSAGVPGKWRDGETLDYEISWGFVSAGNAHLHVRPMPGSADKIEFISRAWNNGFFESVYPVQDTIYTRVGAQSLLPDVFTKTLNEGSYHQKSSIRFDRVGNKAALSDTVFNDDKKRSVKRSFDSTLVLEGGEHCVMSAFYLVRTMDLKPGQTTYFSAVSGKKRYPLKVICHRREKISTVLGDRDCLVVEPMLDGDGIFKSKGRLTIWLTNDDKRIPVKMKTEITLGSVVAELTAYSP